eukprot:7284440-Pyramimonas_sp.AAC.1
MSRAALDRQSTKTREVEQLTEAVANLKSQYDTKNDELAAAQSELTAIKMEVATARAAVMGMARPTAETSSVGDALARLHQV